MHQIEQRPALLDEMISLPMTPRYFIDGDGDRWVSDKPGRVRVLYPDDSGSDYWVFADARDRYGLRPE
jgi:hypothetical protein